MGTNTLSDMKRTPLSLAIGGALLMSASPYGWAQETQTASSNDRLATITVEGNRLYEMLPSEQTAGYDVDAATVGTKVPAALRDIPQSITVVTRDAIEDQNFTTLDELGRRTPGMRVLSNDNGRSSIYARGYEYDEYNIDGLPAPMTSINGSVPSLVAFDRVEIMRGPSGLFNSTSEMGGIVNLVRKRPTDEFQGHISGSIGSYDQGSVETDLSGPIDAEGRIRGRLVIDHTDHPQFVDRNDNEQNDVYAAVDIDLDEATTLGLGFIRNAKDIVVNNGQPVGSDGGLLYSRRSAFYGAEWNDFQSQANDWIAELTHRFANGGYGRIAARYSDRNASYNYAFGGSALDDAGTLSVAGIGSRVDQQALSLDASYSQPFETFGNVSEFVIGSDYKRYETEIESGRSRSLANGRVTLGELNDLDYVDILGAARSSGRGYSYADTTLEETGLYSKLTLRPVQSLALIAGGRLSRYDVDYTEQADGDEDSRSDSEFTPYAGLVYDIGANHSLYASYSQVFKPQTSYAADGGLLEPRDGEQYEVGIKGSYFGGDLNARLSAFRLYDENRAATPDDTGADYVVPVGEMRIQGAEVELVGSLTDQWDVIAGYTYLDTEVQEASTARDDGVFLLMPNNIVNLWTQYSFAGSALQGLHVGGGITALSDFSSSNDVEAPGYAVVDAMLGYDFTSQASGQLNFNNVFDREYYNRVGGTNTFNMVGAPSNIVASLRYDF
ncbi:TonB-dependent siderophore receptor [Halomonas sp. McH1-25]|uniref:TonB-dependent siderophore receptor n=1 Tax=unclassified Halomonas TaxID=2609666 RepID=UPI001EF45251|nr:MULTISPECIES: TonB-dependent siderophore receptor [unclassified Halomonas]MCG7600355.1 TonB-dependent siderophore receptor [Halomonas sp. McH1-25]MCP1344234.1 TonB-dependent siderophore receptor [Halomonas sp. FL8]MCP1361481.1 TonB-dependent siderophore receptor [Halomonas sp. BBD45]